MNPNTPRFHPRHLVRDWRAWVVFVFALYTFAGFVVVPFVAKRQITSQTRELLGCEATLRSLRFNPFTFNLRARDFLLLDRSGDSLATFADLRVNVAPWPATKKVAALESVRLVDPSVFVRIRQDGTLNLLDVVPDTTAAPAARAQEPWLVRLDRLEVEGFTLDVDDASFEPHAHMGIDSLSLLLTGFLSAPGDTAQFATRMLLEHGGEVRASGWVMPLDGVVDARVDVDSLSLRAGDAYLQRQAFVSIRDGRLNVHGQVHVVAPPEELPALTFAGDIVADDLDTFDTLKQEEFFGFDRLAILAAQGGSQPPSARIDEVLIQGIYARVAIAADGSFNVTDAFAPAIARADSIRAASGVAATDSAEVAAMPDVAIGRIRIDGGSVDFSDLSLPLPFATRVHHVGGEITALSPDNAAGSTVLIEGTVDEHGLAKATGSVFAFDPRVFTDLRVDFRNIELTDLTPYSGKFMGYSIKRGKLTLGLTYDIKDSQLKGSNQIFLEKLTLGDKVESSEAVGLPIKLAIALLKDKNGNIDLDLEVAGDLNDPKVNTASLIWQALKKVIVKITTAPFRFLGNLIGIGGDELEFVEFEAGRANLTPPQHERLDNLAKALDERPAIRLEVHGAWNKRSDADALRAMRFEDDLAARLVAAAGGDTTAALAASKDPSSGPMQSVLEAMCTEAVGAQKLARDCARRPRVPRRRGRRPRSTWPATCSRCARR